MKVLPGRSSDSEGPGRFGKCLPKGRASRRPPRRASPRPQDAPTEWSGRRLHGRSPSLRLVGTLAHRVAVQAPHPRPRTGTTGVPGGPPRGGDRSQSASLDTLVGLCVCVHAPRCAYTRARGPSPRRCTAATANGGAARRGPRPGAAPCRPSAYSAAAFPPVSVRLPPAFEPRPASGPDARMRTRTHASGARCGARLRGGWSPYIRQGECRGWMFGEGGLVFRKARARPLLGPEFGREPLRVGIARWSSFRGKARNRVLRLSPPRAPNKTRPPAPGGPPPAPRAAPPRPPRAPGAPARPGGGGSGRTRPPSVASRPPFAPGAAQGAPRAPGGGGRGGAAGAGQRWKAGGGRRPASGGSCGGPGGCMDSPVT